MFHAVPGAVQDQVSNGWDDASLAGFVRRQVDHLVLSTWQPARRAGEKELAEHTRPQRVGSPPFH